MLWLVFLDLLWPDQHYDLVLDLGNSLIKCKLCQLLDFQLNLRMYKCALIGFFT